MIILTLLTLFNALDVKYYFTLLFLGFLIITALLCPYVVRPAWKTRSYFVTMAATLVFLLIVAQKAILIAGEGLS